MTFCLHRHNLTVLDNRGKAYRDQCLITRYYLTDSCGNDWLDWPLYNNQETQDEFLDRTCGLSNRTLNEDSAYKSLLHGNKSTHEEPNKARRTGLSIRWQFLAPEIGHWLWTKIGL